MDQNEATVSNETRPQIDEEVCYIGTSGLS